MTTGLRCVELLARLPTTLASVQEIRRSGLGFTSLRGSFNGDGVISARISSTSWVNFMLSGVLQKPLQITFEERLEDKGGKTPPQAVGGEVQRIASNW